MHNLCLPRHLFSVWWCRVWRKKLCCSATTQIPNAPSCTSISSHQCWKVQKMPKAFPIPTLLRNSHLCSQWHNDCSEVRWDYGIPCALSFCVSFHSSVALNEVKRLQELYGSLQVALLLSIWVRELWFSAHSHISVWGPLQPSEMCVSLHLLSKLKGNFSDSNLLTYQCQNIYLTLNTKHTTCLSRGNSTTTVQ